MSRMGEMRRECREIECRLFNYFCQILGKDNVTEDIHKVIALASDIHECVWYAKTSNRTVQLMYPAYVTNPRF